MNAEYQSAIDIIYQKDRTNPFIFRIPGHRLSQKFVNLCLACQMLKKLSLIDITVSKQFTQLYKQCLTLVIQSPLLQIKNREIIDRVIFHLEYWEHSLGKHSSWPHTRTCFYYLEDKLKKSKQNQLLDFVRLRRGMLQPNKKQFLAQMSSESINSPQLKAFIIRLEQKDKVNNKNDMSTEKIQIEQKQNFNPSDILYQDNERSWQLMKQLIEQVLKQQQSDQKDNKILNIQETLVTYEFQVLPVYFNCQNKKIQNFLQKEGQNSQISQQQLKILKSSQIEQLQKRIQFRKWIYESCMKKKSLQFQKIIIQNRHQLKNKYKK